LVPREGKIEFMLRAEQRGNLTRYALIAAGVRQPGEVAAKEGTGLRYVKARLEESFTGRWTLTGGAVAEGWETVIEIGDSAATARERTGASEPAAMPAQKPA